MLPPHDGSFDAELRAWRTSTMKIGIVTNPAPERHESFRRAALPEMELAFVADNASPDEAVEGLKDCDAIILAAPTANLTVDVLRQCPNVKLVQSILAGYDRIDVKGMSEIGVRFANNGGSNAVPVAEHALALMLALGRNIVRQANNTKARKWADGVRGLPTWELSSKRVGILGLGPIGQAMARLVTGFGGETVYYKRTPASAELESALRAKYVPLDELMSTSDTISVHLALTPETRHLIGAREIALMKPTAIIVNTSRGAVIDEQALYEALKDGRIAGAGLDVLEQEPTPPENPLLELDNAIVTPHQSGISRESGPRSARFAFENARRAVLGEPVQSVIKP
jgi:glyoxylate reductase/D-3-phosphoglycerate dehydrogenase